MILQIRRKLRNVHFLRSAFYFCQTWRERAHFERKLLLAELRNQLQEREDPWNYTNNPEEIDRFRNASALLDIARGDGFFENAFEVGCAEGVFTRTLAPRCKSLLAVDISQAALGRASQHCAGRGVRFEQWDLFTSSAPANLDLVVVMDVLEYFFCPSDIQIARDKLVGSLSPGGYLLLGNSRQNDIFEISWWGKWMLRGGKRIAEFFAEHPRLELVASEVKGIYANALFRVKTKELT